MMKLCIIGPNKFKDRDQEIIEVAKKYFDVEYIPVSKLALIGDVTESVVKYGIKNLSFYDAILVKVPRYKYYLIQHIMKNVDRKVARVQNSRSFRITTSRLSLYQTLNAKGITTPASLYAEDSETIEKNLKDLKFPVLIKIPTSQGKVMLANSPEEAKYMADALQTLGQPLLIEEYRPDVPLLKVFVVNGEVISAVKVSNSELNYVGGIAKKIKPSRKMVNIANLACQSVRTELGVVTMLDTPDPIVVDISVCPYLEELEGKDRTQAFNNLFERLKEISEKGKFIISMPDIGKNLGKMTKFAGRFKRIFIKD